VGASISFLREYKIKMKVRSKAHLKNIKMKNAVLKIRLNVGKLLIFVLSFTFDVDPVSTEGQLSNENSRCDGIEHNHETNYHFSCFDLNLRLFNSMASFKFSEAKGRMISSESFNRY
jgi:hypothetical protein